MFMGLKGIIISIVLLSLNCLMGCGIRGAPIPPSKPNLYNQSYQEYMNEKEKEDEQKNKFRSGNSTYNSL